MNKKLSTGPAFSMEQETQFLKGQYTKSTTSTFSNIGHIGKRNLGIFRERKQIRDF
jgi:hypothetical protein